MQPSHSKNRSLSRRGAAVVFASALVTNLAVAGLVAGWRAASDAPAPELRPAAWAGPPAPSMTALRGSVVLVAFFRPGDEGADELLDRLTAWDNDYRDLGLQVIGVCLPDPGAESDRDAIRSRLGRDLPFPVAIDAQLTCAQAYGIRSSPALAAADRGGRLRGVFGGAGHSNDVQATLSALLAEPTQ